MGWSFSDKEEKQTNKKLDAVISALTFIVEQEKKTMATLEEVKVQIVTLTTKVGALNTALDGYRAAVALLMAQLADLQSGAALPAAVQTQVDDIATSLATAVKEVDDTYKENFPNEPAPEEPTV